MKWKLAGLICVALTLTGCETVKNITSPEVTNAPAPGFENVKAGSEEDFMLNVGRRTYFKSGSAALDDTARVTLDKQADWLKKYTRWKIKLQGFADDPGSPAANETLSRRRAVAVMNYLRSQGVSPERMWAKGYGKSRIVRDCEDISCKSQNRRVISNLREEFDR
ncbi:MAG TPA: OmpA family protein [Rhizobiales bacterium]|nr:OmpA family protein [Hyphomicrobiales bacterium]